MPQKHEYRIRRVEKGESLESAALGVPVEIAQEVPKDTRFQPEWTEDGILYRPVAGTSISEKEVPGWVKDLKGSD